MKLSIFRITPITMSIYVTDQSKVSGWALPASVIVHLLIVVLLIFGLPISLPNLQSEQEIKVDFVKPPEPEKKAKADPPPSAEKPSPKKPPQAKNQTLPSASKDTAPPLPVLKPVVRYGEQDVGPRESQDGNVAEDGSPSPAVKQNAKKQDQAKTPEPLTVKPLDEGSQPAAPENPAAKSASVAEVVSTPKLKQAKKLFSPKVNGDLTATIAMGGLPRSVRAGRLCVTELREQLRHASPPYNPDLLPSFQLQEGTVMEIPNTAFRAEGRWYDLRYRCEVNREATQVVSFAFRVGNPVPPIEWARRGLLLQ
ncbi:MAG: DUF930 domain-containing protein [Rhizobiaceae bacterium]|nr:DUF930 domain-containing protein [Rhizobiaceae bacterium]